MRWPKSWAKCYFKALGIGLFWQACRPAVPSGSSGPDTFSPPDFLAQEHPVAAWERWRQEQVMILRPQVYRLEVRVRYRYGVETYRGTAWNWHPDGYLITCRHLLPQQGTIEIEAWDWTGTCFSARPVWRDSVADVAFLQVQARLAEPLPRATDELPRVGTTVITYGAPWGLLGSFAEGFVSGEQRYLPTSGAPYPLLQLSLPAQPGSSGSPVLNRKGHVVGMISDIASASGTYEGLTFAIPVQVLQQAWERCRSFVALHEPTRADSQRQ